MPIRDFAYVVRSHKTPREALADLWKATVQANWLVLGDDMPDGSDPVREGRGEDRRADGSL